VTYVDYLILNDNYTWPTNFFNQPACGYQETYGLPSTSPVSTPSMTPTAVYNNQHHNHGHPFTAGQLIAVCLTPTLSLLILTIWYFLTYWTPRNPLSTQQQQQQRADNSQL
jgi:hypothetical protein